MTALMKWSQYKAKHSVMQLFACYAAVASFLATVLYDSTVFALQLWQLCCMKLISFIQHSSYSTAAITSI